MPTIDKLLSLEAFVFIIIALGIVTTIAPATGYEISIYEAYPIHFWFLLISATASGIAILIRQAFSKKLSYWWKVGLLIIIFTNSIFLLLPEFRGYPLYGYGDTLTHLGRIKTILSTGHLGENNFYPLVHIIGTSLYLVSSISLKDVVSLFFVLFSGIYIINIYLLARSISSYSGQIFTIVAFASPLIYGIFHVRIAPQMLSIFMLPSLLYFFYRKERLSYNKIQNIVLLLFLAFFITFFHPITTLFAIVLFLTIGLSCFLYPHLDSSKISQIDEYKTISKNCLRISMIVSITFFIWYFSFNSIRRGFKEFYNWWTYGIGISPIQQQLEALTKAELTPMQSLGLFINRHGAVFLLLVVSGIAFISVLYRSLSKRHNIGFVEFAIASQFLTAILMASIALNSVTFYGAHLTRVIEFPILIGTILSGIVFHNFIKNQTSSRQLGLAVGLGILIMVLSMLSFGNVYDSPRVCCPNSQVTNFRLVGSKWLFGTVNPEVPILSASPQDLFKLYNYHQGIASGIRAAGIDPDRIPSYFGYKEHSQINEALGFKERYMAIFQVDKMITKFFPVNVRPKVYQWTKKDFIKLSFDFTATKLYNNGEFEVWRVEK